MVCHNLLQAAMPSGTTNILGLGLNYCIKAISTKETIEKTFVRPGNDVRQIYVLQDMENDKDNCILSLYIKSEYKFDTAPVLLERALESFETAVKKKQQELRNRRSKLRRNLSQGSWNLIQNCRNTDEYIIVAGNKNLGPCIIFREDYIGRGCKDHLGHEQNAGIKSSTTKLVMRARSSGHQ